MGRSQTNSATTAAAKRDYVAIAKRYAERALADTARKKHCRKLQQAAQRFLDDLKRAKKPRCKFYFDPWHANDACDYLEKLPHIEGSWSTPEIKLHPSHVFTVVQTFGFRVGRGEPCTDPDGPLFERSIRRFSSVLFCVARKNAKSTLAAGILLYCLTCEDEPGAQVISAATTFGQARIIFDVAKMQVMKTPDLRDAFGVETFAKSIARADINGSFKPIHSKASTQDGLNPSHVGIDEIHAHKTSDLINVLTSAAGARRNPLWLYTTTEGYITTGPWSEMRIYAANILDGMFGADADHFLVVYFEIDDEDDPMDPECWIKANPLMEVNPELRAKLKQFAAEARGMPSKMAEFKIKRCNRQASSATGWVDLDLWKKCGGKIDLDWLAKYPCHGALDLSSVSDLASWRLVWLIDGRYYTWGRRYCPEDTAHQKSLSGKRFYDGWIARGLLTATSGNRVDYDQIEAEIRMDYERFNIESIAFDRWNAQSLVNNLMQDEFPMIEFVQGTKSYHPAMQALEVAYCKGLVVHGGDPILNWCAANIIARNDVNGSIAPDKVRSPDKIDDMTTLIMGVGRWIAPDDDEGDMMGFLSAPVTA